MEKNALIEKLVQAKNSLLEQISKAIVGQEEVIKLLLISLFSQGHCLIVGVPGLAKTLLVSSFSEILKLNFKRIQFTPDLMPSDIIGIEVLEEVITTGERKFRFIKGPLFANVILADEINRTPPKTQSALLQAMQEYRVTAAGITHNLELPFFVLATQNPIEQEGTYPLPEAQLDRFFFKIVITYPNIDEEKEIIKRTTGISSIRLKNVLSSKEIIKLQEIVRQIPVSDSVMDYVLNCVNCTRPESSISPKFVKDWIRWGAGPRASQYLIIGAKAKAVLEGRYIVSIEDIKYLALPVLRHRIILSFNAEAEGVTVENVIEKILHHVDNIRIKAKK
ncbi:AAA family ATPase [bacterium]